MPTDIALMPLLWLALGWSAYFALHSVLASLTLKRWLAARRPAWMRGYRLTYNLLAVVLLLPLLALIYDERGPWLWQWSGPGWWLANGLALMALLGILWSLRWYDGGEFLGLKQWRAETRAVEDQEGFHLSPIHRFVRHPWYSLGLVLIWTRDMDPPMLVSALMVTLYLVIGSRLEERKLIAYHGDRYRRYRQAVPSLIPFPWKYLTREGAERLVAAGKGNESAGDACQ